MQRGRMAIFVVGLALMLVAGCAGPDRTRSAEMEGKTLRISEKTWADYLEYRHLIGGQRTGAFLVAMRGDLGVAGVYVYCEKGADRCRSQSHAGPIDHAFGLCKQHSLDCVLFARNAEIVASYEVVK